MIDNKNRIASYFDLAEHSLQQKIIFLAVIAAGFFIFFLGVLLPIMEFVFRVYLEGFVYNKTNDILTDAMDSEKQKQVNYLTLWAIDIYKKTPQEARYWFEPITSLFVPSIIFGVGTAIIFTTLLPSKLGLMRQKIEREIANFISKIEYNQKELDQSDIEHQIINADLRELFALSERWNIFIEDLKSLRKGLIWRKSNLLIKIIRINDGLRMYMRYYFTLKYSNAILGFVYMGAAVLIIIIGLRGLKFIPSTQPSLVFFALGLEFSLLITYALTLMYGKQEEETQSPVHLDNDGMSLFSGQKPVNSKEAENLLRVFIKSASRKKE